MIREAVQYLARTLVRRRDIIARTWLNGVNPIVDVALDARDRSASRTPRLPPASPRTAPTRLPGPASTTNPEQRAGLGRETDASRAVPRLGHCSRSPIHRGDDLERAARLSILGAAGPSLFPPRGRRVEDRRTRSNDRLRQPGVNFGVSVGADTLQHLPLASSLGSARFEVTL